MADRTQKKIRETVLAHHAWSGLPIGGGGHRCANILAHRYIGAPIHPAPVVLGPCSITNGRPNISVRLTYFHSNRLLTGLYKQETEIC
jgi:hypothetical protein